MCRRSTGLFVATIFRSRSGIRSGRRPETPPAQVIAGLRSADPACARCRPKSGCAALQRGRESVRSLENLLKPLGGVMNAVQVGNSKLGLIRIFMHCAIAQFP